MPPAPATTSRRVARTSPHNDERIVNLAAQLANRAHGSCAAGCASNVIPGTCELVSRLLQSLAMRANNQADTVAVHYDLDRNLERMLREVETRMWSVVLSVGSDDQTRRALAVDAAELADLFRARIRVAVAQRARAAC